MKPAPKKKNVMTSVDDPLISSDETNEEVAEVAADEETATPAPEAPTPELKAGVVNLPAEVKIGVDVSGVKKHDLVVVTMHETIDPAPRIGTYDVIHKLGVTKLVARKNYRVPKFVAEVLVDCGKAEFLQVD